MPPKKVKAKLIHASPEEASQDNGPIISTNQIDANAKKDNSDHKNDEMEIQQQQQADSPIKSAEKNSIIIEKNNQDDDEMKVPEDEFHYERVFTEYGKKKNDEDDDDEEDMEDEDRRDDNDVDSKEEEEEDIKNQELLKTQLSKTPKELFSYFNTDGDLVPIWADNGNHLHYFSEDDTYDMINKKMCSNVHKHVVEEMNNQVKLYRIKKQLIKEYVVLNLLRFPINQAIGFSEKLFTFIEERVTGQYIAALIASIMKHIYTTEIKPDIIRCTLSEEVKQKYLVAEHNEANNDYWNLEAAPYFRVREYFLRFNDLYIAIGGDEGFTKYRARCTEWNKDYTKKLQIVTLKRDIKDILIDLADLAVKARPVVLETQNEQIESTDCRMQLLFNSGIHNSIDLTNDMADIVEFKQTQLSESIIGEVTNNMDTSQQIYNKLFYIYDGNIQGKSNHIGKHSNKPTSSSNKRKKCEAETDEDNEEEYNFKALRSNTKLLSEEDELNKAKSVEATVDKLLDKFITSKTLDKTNFLDKAVFTSFFTRLGEVSNTNYLCRNIRCHGIDSVDVECIKTLFKSLGAFKILILSINIGEYVTGFSLRETNIKLYLESEEFANDLGKTFVQSIYIGALHLTQQIFNKINPILTSNLEKTKETSDASHTQKPTKKKLTKKKPTKKNCNKEKQDDDEIKVEDDKYGEMIHHFSLLNIKAIDLSFIEQLSKMVYSHFEEETANSTKKSQIETVRNSSNQEISMPQYDQFCLKQRVMLTMEGAKSDIKTQLNDLVSKIHEHLKENKQVPETSIAVNSKFTSDLCDIIGKGDGVSDQIYHTDLRPEPNVADDEFQGVSIIVNINSVSDYLNTIQENGGACQELLYPHSVTVIHCNLMHGGCTNSRKGVMLKLFFYILPGTNDKTRLKGNIYVSITPPMLKLSMEKKNYDVVHYAEVINYAKAVSAFCCANALCQYDWRSNFVGLTEPNRFIHRPFCCKECFESDVANKLKLVYKEKQVKVRASRNLQTGDRIVHDLAPFIENNAGKEFNYSDIGMLSGLSALHKDFQTEFAVNEMKRMALFTSFQPGLMIYKSANISEPILYNSIETMTWLNWIKQHSLSYNCEIIKEYDDKQQQNILSLYCTKNIKSIDDELVLKTTILPTNWFLQSNEFDLLQNSTTNTVLPTRKANNDIGLYIVNPSSFDPSYRYEIDMDMNDGKKD